MSAAPQHEVFFVCYRCDQRSMLITPFGLYCGGCGLRSFADPGEDRLIGQECSNGHRELVQGSKGIRCLACG